MRSRIALFEITVEGACSTVKCKQEAIGIAGLLLNIKADIRNAEVTSLVIQFCGECSFTRNV